MDVGWELKTSAAMVSMYSECAWHDGDVTLKMQYVMDDDCSDSRLRHAHIRALKAYDEKLPLTGAAEALKIAKIPEAFNVKALFSSTTYEEVNISKGNCSLYVM